MSLKDLTRDKHEMAETKPFVSRLLSKDIEPQVYYVYLLNQYYIYRELEERLPLKMLALEDIARSNCMLSDLVELEQKYKFKRDKELIMRSTVEYIAHVHRSITQNPRGLLAHLYVRHFGDMFGGAIISKNLTFSSRKTYEFTNKSNLITKVRALLDDDMADDARDCFDWAMSLFDDLEEWHDKSEH